MFGIIGLTEKVLASRLMDENVENQIYNKENPICMGRLINDV